MFCHVVRQIMLKVIKYKVLAIKSKFIHLCFSCLLICYHLSNDIFLGNLISWVGGNKYF